MVKKIRIRNLKGKFRKEKTINFLEISKDSLNKLLKNGSVEIIINENLKFIIIINNNI